MRKLHLWSECHLTKWKTWPRYRGYSAHEHTILASNIASTALPHDIILETLISVLVVSVGLVLGAEKLKPVSWRDWAGEIERDGGARNPYLSLEERYGFWDIRVSFWVVFGPFCIWIHHPGYIWSWTLIYIYVWENVVCVLRLEANLRNHRPSGRSLEIGYAARMCRSKSDQGSEFVIMYYRGHGV